MSRCLNWLFVCACTLALVGGLAGHAQHFTRCQLTKELQRYTFPRNLIARWVCIIEHASGRTTNKTTSQNSGYSSYGLFQISNRSACMKGKIGGYCKLKCEDLLNTDLADDVLCAKRVYEKSGFKAWPTSYTFCKEKNIPDLSKC